MRIYITDLTLSQQQRLQKVAFNHGYAWRSGSTKVADFTYAGLEFDTKRQTVVGREHDSLMRIVGSTQVSYDEAMILIAVLGIPGSVSYERSALGRKTVYPTLEHVAREFRTLPTTQQVFMSLTIKRPVLQTEFEDAQINVKRQDKEKELQRVRDNIATHETIIVDLKKQADALTTEEAMYQCQKRSP